MNCEEFIMIVIHMERFVSPTPRSSDAELL